MTITLEPDVHAPIRAVTKECGISFKEVLNFCGEGRPDSRETQAALFCAKVLSSGRLRSQSTGSLTRLSRWNQLRRLPGMDSNYDNFK
jgi:hypothetical protein